jgi:hypothetical protein
MLKESQQTAIEWEWSSGIKGPPWTEMVPLISSEFGKHNGASMKTWIVIVNTRILQDKDNYKLYSLDNSSYVIDLQTATLFTYHFHAS